MAEGVLVAVGGGLAEPGVGLHHVLRHAGTVLVTDAQAEHGFRILQVGGPVSRTIFLAMTVAVGVCCEHD